MYEKKGCVHPHVNAPVSWPTTSIAIAVVRLMRLSTSACHCNPTTSRTTRDVTPLTIPIVPRHMDSHVNRQKCRSHKNHAVGTVVSLSRARRRYLRKSEDSDVWWACTHQG